MTGPIDESAPGDPRAPHWGVPAAAGQGPRRVLWDDDPVQYAPETPTGPDPGRPQGGSVAGYGHSGPLSPTPPPLPLNLPEPHDRPPPRAGISRLALIAVAGVVAVVVGTVVILGTRSGTPVEAAPTPLPTAAPGYGAAIDPTEDPTDEVTTDAPPPTEDPTTDPTDPTAIPDGYVLTSGPAGIEVPVPTDWQVGAGAVPTNMQADDPTVPGRLLRFGGDPATNSDPLQSVEYAEAHTPSIRSGYQRLRLEPVSYGNSGSAADWEFTFVKDGETRHAYGRYWYDNGTIYVVYLSAPDSEWAASSQVLDVVLNHSTD